MKCFYHGDDEAVGICKSCHKALCSACAVDVGKGLACAGSCEDDVRQLNAMIDTSVRYAPASRSLVASGRRTGMLTAVLVALMGVVFLWLGLSADNGLWFATVIGGVFVLYGVIQFVRMFRLSSATPGTTSGDAT